MNIQEIKDARAQLAKAIAKLIQDFEWNSDTVVGSIKIEKSKDEFNPGRPEIVVNIIIP